MTTAKGKRRRAVIATVAAATILLGGTFAWTSISQQAKNEAIVDINPGGRLHDDFNGSNKDVYVENFNTGTDAVSIYARVRLDEYMEIGQDAGKDPAGLTEPKRATAVKGKGEFGKDKLHTWQAYKPGTGSLENTENVSDEYWTLKFGNVTKNKYYMPTFNKNKDSLAADINGTYEGTTEGDIIRYDDYIEYGVTSSKWDFEYFDWDSDTFHEPLDIEMEHTAYNGGVTQDASLPKDGADILKSKEMVEHTAKQISYAADVITMTEWTDPDNDYYQKTGPFWVYDDDGWAYWAQPVKPGETTGLLLDGIEMKHVPDDSWYYGINVIGQFVTASDLSAFESGGSFTGNAQQLMELAIAADKENGGIAEDASESPAGYIVTKDGE